MTAKKNRVEATFLLAATAAGAFLRFYRIGKECLWFDEIYTTWRASLSLGALTDDLARAVLFPPLYFYLLKAWGSLFGTFPAALRTFSALWGIAAIPVAYFLAREMFGRKAAVISSTLLVFSSFNIYYSQETKMYTMWWTLLLLSNLSFVRMVKFNARRCDFWLYIVSTAAAMWTFNLTVFAIMSQMIYLAAVHRSWKSRRKWFQAYLFIALIYCPWPLIFLVRNLISPQGEGVRGALSLTWGAIEWIPIPDLRSFFMNFVIFISGMRLYVYDLCTWAEAWHTPFRHASWLCLLVLGFLLYPIFRERTDRWGFRWLIVILVLFPSVSMFLYSLLARPLWHPRYLGYISVLLFIAIGYGYSLSDRKLLSGAAIGILLILNFSVLDFYYSDRVKMPWDELVVYLASRVESGDSVLFPYEELARSMEYHWNLDEERKNKELKLEYPYAKKDEIREKVKDFEYVWLVLNYSMPRGRRRPPEAGIEVSGYMQERLVFANGLEIIHYVHER